MGCSESVAIKTPQQATTATTTSANTQLTTTSSPTATRMGEPTAANVPLSTPAIARGGEPPVQPPPPPLASILTIVPTSPSRRLNNYHQQQPTGGSTTTPSAHHRVASSSSSSSSSPLFHASFSVVSGGHPLELVSPMASTTSVTVPSLLQEEEGTNAVAPAAEATSRSEHLSFNDILMLQLLTRRAARRVQAEATTTNNNGAANNNHEASLEAHLVHLQPIVDMLDPHLAQLLDTFFENQPGAQQQREIPQPQIEALLRPLSHEQVQLLFGSSQSSQHMHQNINICSTAPNITATPSSSIIHHSNDPLHDDEASSTEQQRRQHSSFDCAGDEEEGHSCGGESETCCICCEDLVPTPFTQSTLSENTSSQVYLPAGEGRSPSAMTFTVNGVEIVNSYANFAFSSDDDDDDGNKDSSNHHHQEEEEVVVGMPNCDHYLHRSCAVKAIRRGLRACPLCRTPFTII